jgi:purine catabolism regulator
MQSPLPTPANNQVSGRLTVKAVIAIESLGLVVHAGQSALNNPIDIAHVSELPTAPECIEGGGFLMTSGLMLDDTAEAWNRYVNTLAARGAAALALALGPDLAHQHMPRRLVAAADRCGLPLLEVPAGTTLMAVTRAIVAARVEIDRRILEQSFALQRDLTSVAARDGGLTGLVQAWHLATGEAVVVFDRRGRTLASSPGFSAGAAEAIAAAVPDVPRLVEDFMPIATSAGVAVVSAVGATRHAGYLARLGDSLELGSRAVATLLSLLALEFERRWLVDEPERRARANQLARLLSTDDDARASAQLRALGIRTRTVQAVAIQARSEAHAEEVLADVTIALGTDLVRRRGHIVEALTINDPREGLTALELSSPVGIGAPAAPGLAARSMRQALTALATSERTGAVVEYVDGRCHDFLLQVADPAYLNAFADAVLGPIDGAENGETLIETLHAWLAEGRSVEGCSERLGVHRHTVRNRIQRVTQLLGRGVESVDAQTELWLALKARGLRDES